MIAMFGESTSFVDRGILGVVLDNGSTYACRAGECRTFMTSTDEVSGLVNLCGDSDFLHAESTHQKGLRDGSSFSVAVATPTKSHIVSSYGARDPRMGALAKALSSLIKERFAIATSVTHTRARDGLEAHMRRWPSADPRAELLRKWMLGVLPDAGGGGRATSVKPPH